MPPVSLEPTTETLTETLQTKLSNPVSVPDFDLHVRSSSFKRVRSKTAGSRQPCR